VEDVNVTVEIVMVFVIGMTPLALEGSAAAM